MPRIRTKAKPSPKKKKKKDSLFDDKEDDEEISTRKYKDKNLFVQAIVADSSRAAIKAKADNNGRLPHRWLQKKVVEIQSNANYDHLNLKKVEDDIKNKIRSLENEEKKRAKEEKARIDAAVAAAASASSRSRVVASSKAHASTDAATAAVPRVSLSPRDAVSSDVSSDVARSMPPRHLTTTGLDLLAQVAETKPSNVSTGAVGTFSSQVVTLPAGKCSHADCKFVNAVPKSCSTIAWYH